MRIAIIYNDEDVYIEIPPDEFIRLLENKLEDGKSVTIAMSEIVMLLKSKTLTS